MENRPGMYGKEVVALVAEELVPEVLEWLKGFDSDDPCFTDPEEMEHLKKQVTKAVERGFYDAFDTAKYLSDNGWEADGELVDIFEGAEPKAYFHHEKLVMKWVASNEIKPEFAIGDKVTFNNGKMYQGEITEVRERTAQYTIFCEELGHKKPSNEPGMRRLGSIIPFEDTKAVTE
jgi:hypothetical protein